MYEPDRSIPHGAWIYDCRHAFAVCGGGSLMRRSSLIGHAVEALGLFLESRRPADSILREFYNKRRYLGSKDRRFISETVFGTLRNFAMLHVLAEQAFSRLRASLPAGAAEATVLIPSFLFDQLRDDLPELLSDCDALWRMYVRDVALEAYVHERDKVHGSFKPPTDTSERLALEYSLPHRLVSEWVERLGLDETEQLCRASNTPGPTTVRVNTLRGTVEECRDLLRVEGITALPTHISPQGLTLDRRVFLPGIRAFRAGLCEPQDEGSQLIGFLVAPQPGEMIIDACAGSGGKSLHLAALMGNKGRLVALDLDNDRLTRLKERRSRAGVACIETMLFPQGVATVGARSADAVLVDAPCTSSGTFRRNPGMAMKFRTDQLKKCVSMQNEILSVVSEWVRPGGRLVYVTCSLLAEENEYQVAEFLRVHPDFFSGNAQAILHDGGISLDCTGDFMQLFPHRHGTDGFFAAVLVRR